MRRPWLSLFFLRAIATIKGIEFCSSEQGGGICPDGNTCCLTKKRTSGCIPADMGALNATCCGDLETGCPLGYRCRTIASRKDCLVNKDNNLQDELVQVLPRYHLCQAEEIQRLYGLIVDEVTGTKLAYYSSEGSLEKNQSIGGHFDRVLIVIHGANRNADDYFCSAKSAWELHNSTEMILIIAPVFYSIADVRQDPLFLAWADDKDGPWRYGADSVHPIQTSSFAALDMLVERVLTLFPSVVKVIVAGHSSGGQAVQRWSLLTHAWWKSKMRAVVANPSSFAYLSPLRYTNGSENLPLKDSCPNYDQWEWGLESGGSFSVPYRDEHLMNTTSLVDRFRDRTIVYLTGGLDRCNVSQQGWCDSHGLEMTCMDELQGSNRFERSMRYMNSLQRLGFDVLNRHTHVVIGGVGHDHSLMFQSLIGRRSLFG